ncbi:MAG: SDR family NAD(P)-dependent oxidoreductase [Alphaproteobacteria bacterium]
MTQARDSNDLTGRRILVTGAASGIGRASAERLAAQGARTALLDRSDAVVAVAKTLPGAVALQADVADEASVQAAVAEAARQLGGLDGVVNAAGTYRLGTIADTRLADWNSLLAVNLTGPFLVCRAAAPFLKQAADATVVNVASGGGLRPVPLSAAYCAAKAGLIMFTKSLAMELAPTVRANAVCPGATDTPLFRDTMASTGNTEAATQAILSSYLIKRLGTPAEIAEVILFLTSRASSFLSGCAIAADPGRTMH